MFDLVVNHTSDKHAFFEESRSSRTNAKADWYIWRDAKINAAGQRSEPNNWASIWGGSAWTWDETRQQFYLHLFSPQQPDLNWDCLEVRKEILDIVNRWQRRGVDGWRLDAINFISKPQNSQDASLDLPDAPVTDPSSRYQPAFCRFNHGPNVHRYLKELYQQCLQPDVMTVGEAAQTTPQQTAEYCSWERPDRELQMVFGTDHVDLYGGFEIGPPKPLRHGDFISTVNKWATTLLEHGSWASVFVSNHDQPRPVNNILRGSAPEHRVRAAKLLALFECCLTGTLFVYQGEEIGMINVPEDWPIEDYPDLVTQKFYYEELERRKEMGGSADPDMSDVMLGINRKARDNARVPMPWDDTPLAGFTTGKPWMRVNEDNRVCNVAAQVNDKDSVLSFWKECIALRKSHPALNYGTFELVPARGSEDVCSFVKTHGKDRLHFVANFGQTRASITIPGLHLGRCELVKANFASSAPSSDGDVFVLEPFEARLLIP